MLRSSKPTLVPLFVVPLLLAAVFTFSPTAWGQAGAPDPIPHTEAEAPVWDPDPALGQHRATTGDINSALVPDGRMTAPQDQRGQFDATASLPIAPGASLGCIVEEASDLDTLTAINGTTSEASSEVHYTWEAVRGGEGTAGGATTGGTGTATGSVGEWTWRAMENGVERTFHGPLAPTRSATWTAPTDVTAQTTFTLRCTLDDAEGAIAASETGDRDDSEVVREVTVITSLPPTGTPGGGTGNPGGGAGGGTMPTPTPTPCFMTLTADNETWHSVQISWSECSDSDFGSYTLYRSTQASFTPAEENRILQRDASQVQSTEYPDTGLQPETTYYYILRTAHGGTTTDAPASVTTTELDVPAVTFEGLARSCAGGVGVDGVHDFSITGTARREDGSLATNTQFKLSFEGNKGHDYGDGREKKEAKFVTTDANGNQILVRELTVTSDNEGKFGVQVLSSDIISSDIQIQVKWENSQRQLRDAGSKNCDFAEAEAKRRFPNETEPDEVYPRDDNGWKFVRNWLGGPNSQTTAKMYLKFRVDRRGGSADGNWEFVAGHQMLFEVANLEMKDGEERDSPDSDYAIIVPTQQQMGIYSTASVDGAATAILRAGNKIADVKTITLSVYDQSQWSE